jgi:hypothetical protein
MHKWISTDSGDQCFRCGVVLDWRTDEPTDTVGWDGLEKAAHDLVPGCPGPVLDRGHHYVLGWDGGLEGGYILECAYGDARSTGQAWTANHNCKGA